MKKVLFSLIIVSMIVGVAAMVGCGNQEADQSGAEPTSTWGASYDEYLVELNRTNAYYSADAMMQNVFVDLYNGSNIYDLNLSDPARYNRESSDGYLGSGFNISTSINTSVLWPVSSSPEGQDYTIVVTATNSTSKVASITTCLRQASGPSKGWENQSVMIFSWQIEYY